MPHSDQSHELETSGDDDILHFDREPDDGTWTKVTSKKGVRRLSSGSAKSHTSVHTTPGSATPKRRNATPRSTSRKHNHGRHTGSPHGTNPVTRDPSEYNQNTKHGERAHHARIAWRVPFESKPPSGPKKTPTSTKHEQRNSGTKRDKTNQLLRQQKQERRKSSVSSTVPVKTYYPNVSPLQPSQTMVLGETTNYSNATTNNFSEKKESKEHKTKLNLTHPYTRDMSNFEENVNDLSLYPISCSEVPLQKSRPNSAPDFTSSDASQTTSLNKSKIQRSTSGTASVGETGSVISSLHEGDQEKLRLKLWNVLFRNVNRSVDELYYMCEYESSIEQCGEAILALEMSIQEFADLRERIETQDKFEQARHAHREGLATNESLIHNQSRLLSGKNCDMQNESECEIQNCTSDDGPEFDRPSTIPRNFQHELQNGAPTQIGKGVAWEVRKDNLSPSPAATLLIETTKAPPMNHPAPSSVSNTKNQKSYASVIRTASKASWKSEHTKPETDESFQNETEKKKLIVHLSSGSQVKLAQAQSREQRQKSIAKLVDSSAIVANPNTKQKLLTKLNAASMSAWVRKPNIVPDLISQAKQASKMNGAETESVESRGGDSPTSLSFSTNSSDTSTNGAVSDITSNNSTSSERTRKNQSETRNETGNSCNQHGSNQEMSSDNQLEDVQLNRIRETEATYSNEFPLNSGEYSSNEEISCDEDTGDYESNDCEPYEDQESSFDTSLDQDLRWGDESVGMSREGIEMIAPISPSKKSRRVAPALPPALRDMLAKSLHDKLSSPERRKPSPSETRRRQVEKQITAQLNRAKLELQRQARLKLQAERQHAAAKIKQQETIANEKALLQKLERAAAAREANLRKVVKKAEVENIKVNEILFINEMTELDKEAQLHKKLEDGERRRLEYIDAKLEKAKRQSERDKAAADARKRREGRLRQQMETRLEEAKRRKEQVMLQHKRRLDEYHIEAPAKASERREELEREREARILAIKQRELRAIEGREKILSKRSSGKLFASQLTSETRQCDPLDTVESSDSPSSLSQLNCSCEASHDGSCSPLVGFTQNFATNVACPLHGHHGTTISDMSPGLPPRPRSAGASLGGKYNRLQHKNSSDASVVSAHSADLHHQQHDDDEVDVGEVNRIHETTEIGNNEGGVNSKPVVSATTITPEEQEARKLKALQDKNRKKKKGKIRKSQTTRITQVEPIYQQVIKVTGKSGDVPGASRVRKLVRSLGKRDVDGEPTPSQLSLAAASFRDLARIMEGVVIQQVPVLRCKSMDGGYVNPFSTLHTVGRSPKSPTSESSCEGDTNANENSQQLFHHTTLLDCCRDEGGLDVISRYITPSVAREHPKVMSNAFRALLAATCDIVNVEYCLVCTKIAHKILDVLAVTMGPEHRNATCDHLQMVQWGMSMLSVLLRAGTQASSANPLHTMSVESIDSSNVSKAKSFIRQEAAACQGELVRYSIHSQVLDRIVSAMFALRVGETWMGCCLGGVGIVETQSSNTNELHSGIGGCGGEKQIVVSGGEHVSTQEDLKVDVNTTTSTTSKNSIDTCKLDSALGFLHSATNLLDALLCTTYPPCDALVDLLKEMDTRTLSLIVASFHSVDHTEGSASSSQKSTSRLRSISRAKTVALHVLRMMNHVARHDLEFAQDALSAPALQFEFQQLLKCVRAACDTSTAADKVAETEWIHPDTNISDHLLAEYVVLLGYYALDSKANQESLNWGLSPTPLQHLCSLPFRYYVSPGGKDLLLPTLMAICLGNARNLAIVAEEINPKLFSDFIQEQRQLAGTGDSARLKGIQYSHLDVTSRFPRKFWDKAEEYFSSL